MRALSFLIWLCPATALLSTEPIQFQSATNQTSLLEFYTSEGCSSCPPADAWLSRLKDNPRLWKDFVPLAFHVDYWDYLGWKDPFASPEFSKRQHDDAEWRNRSIYTPGFILNGQEWREWFDRDKLPRVSSKPGGTLTVSSEDGQRWLLRFEPAATNQPASLEFHAALLGFGLISDVKAGENRGRRLEHDFVVLTMAKAWSSKVGNSFQGAVSLLLPSGKSPKRFAVAAWVTPSNAVQPLQAAGSWISLTNR